MVVVTAIIGILSALTVVSERNFDNSTVLINAAYDVALSMRETQSLGLTSSSVQGINNAGYGIHIGDSKTSYVQFADIYPAAPGSVTIDSLPLNSYDACPGHHSAPYTLPDSRPGDCYYEQSQGETVRTYTLPAGYTFTYLKYCRPIYGCQTPVAAGGSTFFNIVYERPNIQAEMSGSLSATNIISISDAEIQLSSQSGSNRCIIADALGEVYVQSGACP
jgi:hypothetical protein